MKFIVVLFAAFAGHSLSAASLTCMEIQQAEIDKAIAHSPFTSKITNLPVILLREAAVISGQYTQDEVRLKTDQSLQADLKPVIDNIRIGAREFHSVNLDLGDNAYIYLFDLDTQDYTGVASEDGSVMVDEEFCKTQNSDIL
ncbi:MAG: hypothetical protein AB7H97_20135 [Pseudobdellovibrionaceae bacterium]